MHLVFVGGGLVARDVAFAQETGADANPQGGIAVGRVSPAGSHAYVPGRWGTLQIELRNPTDEPLDLLATTYFDGEPTLQYGRRAWVPPQSRLRTWHPIRLPNETAEGGQRYDFQTLVMSAGQGTEVLLRSDTGALRHGASLRATNSPVVTGMIAGLFGPDTPERDDAHELVVAARSGEQFNRDIPIFGDRIFTPGEQGLDALDSLVVMHERLMYDEAGLSAVRNWLYGGGRLWVMLDQVDPRLLQRLLVDEFQCEVVDRVGLTTVAIESAARFGRVGKTVAEHEQPVDLLRIITADVDMAYTVNGWPAAFWKTCGQGRLLVTTLGPRGWMRPRSADDRPDANRPESAPRPGGPEGGGPGPAGPVSAPAVPAPVPAAPTKYVSLESMKELASDFLKPRPDRLLARSALEARVQEYVGYSIPARGLVVGVLVGFGLLLAAAGALLWRTERLEWLGLAGPALAVTASAGLIGIGRAHRQAVPPTAASSQLVHAIPGADEVRVEGITGLYSPETGVARIGSTRGGWILPDMTGLDGQTRRMVWTDLEQWQWENLPQFAGLRMVEFQQSGPIAARLGAHARFGPQGLIGRLDADQARDASDAIIATRFGRIGIDLKGDGTFEARADDVFSPEQFLAARYLSDEQSRRRDTLESLMPLPAADDDADGPARPQNPRNFPLEPMLLFWSAPWDLGFEFGSDRRADGAALALVPLRFERPAGGTEIVLPVPLLPFREDHGPDGAAPSGMYGNQTQVWNKKSFPASKTWLRFQIPPVLLPVEALRARIRAQVKGPIGRFELAGASGKEVAPIKTWIDPVGGLAIEVTDPAMLGITDDGGLYLRVAGGDDSRPELTRVDNGSDTPRTVFWKIETLTVELTLKVLDVESAARPDGG